MSDDLVKQSIAELQDLVRCRCHDAYKDRGLHDPDCHCDSAEAPKVVAERIEELESKLATCKKYRDAYAECDRIATQAVRDLEVKLAKAVEGFEELARLGNGDRYGNSFGNLIAQKYIAELTGGKDE